MSKEGFKGMTVNERLYFAGRFKEFEKALKKNKSKAREILKDVYVDEISIDLIINNKNQH